MSFGRFKGEVAAKWLQHEGDDRNMQLLRNFSFTDPEGKEWRAPKGSTVNGASIPPALWDSIGPPFVGDYRRASVVHDVACDNRSRTSDEAHLMFYNAMRADGVGWVKANVMYQAVKQFGPQWGANGSLRKKRKPKDEVVTRYIKAVEEAANEVDESQGLKAVQIAAEKKIGVISNKTGSSTKKTTDKKKNTKANLSRKKVSRLGSTKRTRKSSKSEKDLPLNLAAIAPCVRKQLASSRPLASFRNTEINALEPSARRFVGKRSLGSTTAMPPLDGSVIGDPDDGLSQDGRIALVDQALVLIEQNYVHRPLKESLYAINPVRKLRLLREELLNSSESSFEGDIGFHRKLLRIFLSTRDLHMNYHLPSPFKESTVYLPFLVEDYFDPNDSPTQRRFLVSRVVGDAADSLATGVEITRWNGTPIEKAVEINGERFAGSNREASRARGLETLTVRPLLQSLPPDEDFVVVEFKKSDGELGEARFDWMVFSPDTADMPAMSELDELTASVQGIDLEQTMVRWVKKVLFAPEAVAEATRMSRRSTAAQSQGLQSLLPDALEAKAIELGSQEEYGYLRIRTFSVGDVDQFVREFVRLVEQLPQNGLIIDVRGNGGGIIPAGEQILQVLTPRRITPTLFQMLVTPLNRTIAEELDGLAQWRKSMRQAVQSGAVFSQGFPITSPEKANEIGQRYFGPVTLITDALCYSTTDIFAAGFQDHEIGTIIGIDNNTGAGGANVWTHDWLSKNLPNLEDYTDLPSNAGMRVSMLRTVRVGKSNGTVLEDFGVVPDLLHPMTKNDLLEGNVDLLAKAAEVLNEQPVRRLVAEVVIDQDDIPIITIDSDGIDRVDLYEGTRPIDSIDIDAEQTELSLEELPAQSLRLVGFENGELVASRVVEFQV